MLCIYVAVGVKMDVPGETTTKRYASMDEKVDLLIERMSECVRLVRGYMDQNMLDGQHHPGDRAVFGVMLRDFPPCIGRLRNYQERLQTAQMLSWGLKSARATELGKACDMIYTFHNNSWGNTGTPVLSHVRNEMQNLIRFQQNLYPTEDPVLGVFTLLNKRQGPLIKWFRQDTQDFVVVAEYAFKTECCACYANEREVVLYPCQHWVLCRKCKESVHLCPICRSHIVEYRFIGDVKREGLPAIQAAEFSGCWVRPEGYTRRLLHELQALGD